MRLMKYIAKLKRMDLTLVITMLTGFLITILKARLDKAPNELELNEILE